MEISELPRSRLCSGRFVLFRITNWKSREEIFVVRAHPAFDHKNIMDAFQKEFEKSSMNDLEFTVLGGAFMHIYEWRKKKTVVLNGASQSAGPISVVDLPYLLHLILENFLGFRVLYEHLEF